YIFRMAEKKQHAQMRSKSKAKAKTKTKAKKAAGKSKVTAAAKQTNRRNVAAKKVRPAPKKKRSRTAASKEIHSPEPSTLSGRIFPTVERPSRSRAGSGSDGQSGDMQALSRRATVDSESVEELLEEGQAREAAAVSGVENALDPDQSEVHTREVPEDDVPEE